MIPYVSLPIQYFEVHTNWADKLAANMQYEQALQAKSFEDGGVDSRPSLGTFHFQLLEVYDDGLCQDKLMKKQH